MSGGPQSQRFLPENIVPFDEVIFLLWFKKGSHITHVRNHLENEITLYFCKVNHLENELMFSTSEYIKCSISCLLHFHSMTLNVNLGSRFKHMEHVFHLPVFMCVFTWYSHPLTHAVGRTRVPHVLGWGGVVWARRGVWGGACVPANTHTHVHD